MMTIVIYFITHKSQTSQKPRGQFDWVHFKRDLFTDARDIELISVCVLESPVMDHNDSYLWHPFSYEEE